MRGLLIGFYKLNSCFIKVFTKARMGTTDPKRKKNFPELSFNVFTDIFFYLIINKFGVK
jgi:hypothetical protein